MRAHQGKSRRHRQRGQTVVELALALPVLLILLVGMAEFATMSGGYLTMQHAVREGLRAGLTGASDTAIIDLVRSRAPNLNTERLEVTVAPADSQRLPGSDLAVAATFRYPVTTPVLAQILGGEVPLSARLVGRVE